MSAFVHLIADYGAADPVPEAVHRLKAADPDLDVFAVPAVGVRFATVTALIVGLYWLSTAALAVALAHVASLSLSDHRRERDTQRQ